MNDLVGGQPEEQKTSKNSMIGFNNNLANKLNEIKSKPYSGAGSNIITKEQIQQKWFMTPSVGLREVSETEVLKNRAKIMAMHGGGTGGDDATVKHRVSTISFIIFVTFLSIV